MQQGVEALMTTNCCVWVESHSVDQTSHQLVWTFDERQDDLNFEICSSRFEEGGKSGDGSWLGESFWDIKSFIFAFYILPFLLSVDKNYRLLFLVFLSVSAEKNQHCASIMLLCSFDSR